MARQSKNEATTEKLDLPAEYGGLSVGDNVTSLGIIASKGAKVGTMSIKQAERYCCGARCFARITIDPNAAGDTPGQALMSEPADVIAGTVDITSYRSSSNPDSVRFKLSFSNKEVDPAKLLPFRKERGRLVLERLGDVESNEEGD